MNKINKETVLSWFLAFVAVWFGVVEVLHPAAWTSFVPDMAKTVTPAIDLVSIHGVLLVVLGLALAFNFYRRVAAVILAIVILEIVFFMLQKGGLNPIVVRDIGLFGMAFALSFKN